MAKELPLTVVPGEDINLKGRYSLRDAEGVKTFQSLAGKELRGAMKTVDAKGKPKALLLDLTPYLTADADQEGEDTKGVFYLRVPGSASRSVNADGRYDVFVSDPGTTDAFARRLLKGDVTVEWSMTTAADPE